MKLEEVQNALTKMAEVHAELFDGMPEVVKFFWLEFFNDGGAGIKRHNRQFVEEEFVEFDTRTELEEFLRGYL